MYIEVWCGVKPFIIIVWFPGARPDHPDVRGDSPHVLQPRLCLRAGGSRGLWLVFLRLYLVGPDDSHHSGISPPGEQTAALSPLSSLPSFPSRAPFLGSSSVVCVLSVGSSYWPSPYLSWSAGEIVMSTSHQAWSHYLASPSATSGNCGGTRSLPGGGWRGKDSILTDHVMLCSPQFPGWPTRARSPTFCSTSPPLGVCQGWGRRARCSKITWLIWTSTSSLYCSRTRLWWTPRWTRQRRNLSEEF